MILKFILLIFPKYVAVLQDVQIENHYSKLGATTRRFIDIVLVDANGSLDVIEIKRPFNDVLLSKTRYRDNFVPTKDLSGTIMQAEKYLFDLSKWGVAGETKLTNKYRQQLPLEMSIRSPTLRRCSFWAVTEGPMVARPSIRIRRSTWTSLNVNTRI